jgi:prepilin-type N-terminal cleavage/methylation domain-containing protein
MMAVRKNKGYTLVEVMVVVALLGIAIGIVATSIATVFSANAKKCAYNMEAMIAQAKINTMYKTAPVFVEFYVLDGTIWGQYYEGGVATQVRENMGSAKIAVSFETAEGGSYTLDATHRIYVGFERGTGALRNLNTIVPPITGFGFYGRPTEISLSNSSLTYVVVINQVTGKHEVTGR